MRIGKSRGGCRDARGAARRAAARRGWGWRIVVAAAAAAVGGTGGAAVGGTGGAAVGGTGGAAVGGTGGAAAITSGTASAASSLGGHAVVQTLVTKKYGTVLVTSLGPLADVPLFELSSDTKSSFACTHETVTTYEGPLTCTGPESDFLETVQSDEWPAFTTEGQPLAGPGARASLLGSVYRPGIGDQVTYAGHPLYLFTGPSSPFVPAGEGFFESVLPLPDWHGIWDLVSAATGGPATGPAEIGTGTLPDGTQVVAVQEYPNAVPGGVAFTAYVFGAGAGTGPACPAGSASSASSASCSTKWIPVLTQGTPQAVNGASQRALGVVPAAQGWQVTYDGRPLWLYAYEAVVLTTKGPQTTGTVGNGVGVAGPDGDAAAVVPA